MKRVFHFVTNSTANGLEKLVMTICQLVDGYDYTYVVPEGPIEEKLKDKKINYILLKEMNFISVKKVIKKYKPDIVHGHDVKASLYLASNYRYCKKNHIKIISELHNDDQRMHKVGLRSLLYRYSCKFYDSVVCVSKDVYDNYVFKESIKNKSIIIDNVVDPIIKKTPSVTSFKFDCVFVGRFEFQKNPQRFVKAMNMLKQKLPDLKALMIGEGSLKDDVINLIRELNLSDNIEVINYQDNPYRYIKESKSIYMPSRFEGFGLVALESMLIGTPVICHRVTGLSKMVNNTCGLISDDDSEVTDEIFKLSQDVQYREIKSRCSVKRGNEINSVEKFISKYKMIYG